jgi:molecular chaperone GrpE
VDQPANQHQATDQPAPTNGSDSVADDIQAATSELEAQVAELQDRWRRALADLDNLRKRLAREIEAARADERARVVAQFLPVIDHLELALGHAQADPGALIEGVRVVRDQAVGLLEHLGFRRIDEAGVPFDPARHEAIGTVKDPNVKPGTVVKVVRPGYARDGSQLRPAGVIVATGDQ